MTNRELQDLLKQYPDDMPIGSIQYDPDHPNDWEVIREVGVIELAFGYGNQPWPKERCLVIN